MSATGMKLSVAYAARQELAQLTVPDTLGRRPRGRGVTCFGEDAGGEAMSNAGDGGGAGGVKSESVSSSSC